MTLIAKDIWSAVLDMTTWEAHGGEEGSDGGGDFTRFSLALHGLTATLAVSAAAPPPAL